MNATSPDKTSRKASVFACFRTFSWLCVLLVALPTCVMAGKKASPFPLYPGITPQQDAYALEAIRHIYMFEWESVDSVCMIMQELEEREDLPPLSHLFLVAGRVLMIQNDEYPDPRTKSQLLREAQQIASQGIYRTKQTPVDANMQSTYFFIRGGIQGFMATLKIKSNPLTALAEGLNGLVFLDTALKLNPRMYDAYLGFGLFNCAAAKAPGIVKNAIGFLGHRTISFDKGLDALQQCAKKGRYTQTASRQYLIQFLSPYDSKQLLEKKLLFSELQEEYPQNPFFLFQDIDESLCFYPDTLLRKKTNAWLKTTIDSYKLHNYSTRRYGALVKQQYFLLRTGYDPIIAGTDTLYTRADFGFYPLFLDAVRKKFDTKINPILTRDQMRSAENALDLAQEKCFKKLENSTMNELRKDYYRWHIRDGLRFSRVY